MIISQKESSVKFLKNISVYFQMGQQLFKETEFILTNFTQSGCKDM